MQVKLSAFVQTKGEKTMKLFPPQEEILERGLLENNEHCFLNMATGSGKTFLAEIAIEKVLQSGYKAVYVTPLRALAAQQQERWTKRFQGYQIGVFTGETIQKSSAKASYSKSQILIMTPERLDACMRNWRTHWTWIPDVSLVVIDEYHITSAMYSAASPPSAFRRRTSLKASTLPPLALWKKRYFCTIISASSSASSRVSNTRAA